MNATRITVCGSSGRMGRLLLSCAIGDPELEIVGEIDSDGDLNALISNADVVIDFTTAAATLGIARIAASAGKALVIGTTGHSESQKNAILEAVRDIPVVWTSNFSTGVNILFYLAEIAAKHFPAADAEVKETHHRNKKDAPSGTAKTLGEILAHAGKEDVQIRSLRTGDVVGDHAVIFTTPEETLTLTHHAADRAAFARGALNAAKWVAARTPGIYDMRQVLGLRE